jgi:hypothetical protein
MSYLCRSLFVLSDLVQDKYRTLRENLNLNNPTFVLFVFRRTRISIGL